MELQNEVGCGGVAVVGTLSADVNILLKEAGSLLILIKRCIR